MMTNKSWLLLITLSVTWGSSFYFAEVLLAYINPFAIVFLRVTIASVILTTYCFISRRTLPTATEDWLNLIIMALINNVIPFSLIAMGQQTITGGLAAILNASTALFSILFCALFLREPLSPNRIIGVIVGMVGVAITIGWSHIIGFSWRGNGEYLVLLAAILYAIAGIWGLKKLHHLEPITATTGMLICSSIMMFGLVSITDSWTPAMLNTTVIANATGFSILGSIIGFLLYYKILHTAGASNVTLCTILSPPCAILLGSLFLNQFITWRAIFGLVVIALGLLILDGRTLKRIRQLKICSSRGNTKRQ